MASVNLEAHPLPNLETFSKAAELSSFTGAGKSLRLTQAAVSQRIHALEAVVGAPLFHRQGGRVVLTEAGQRLYGYAQRILDLHREAYQEISGRRPPVVGDLTLAASSIPGEHLLPAMLASFGKAYTEIKVRASVSDSKSVMTQVERGDVQLGLVGSKVETDYLDYRFIAKDRMVLVVPSIHPLGKLKIVTLKHLTEYPLVIREVGSGLRHCFERAIERNGFTLGDLRITLELGSNEAIKEAVRQGVGVAVLSMLAVRREVQDGFLKVLEIENVTCDRDLFVIQDRRRALPQPARLFLTVLDAHIMSV
ncbi:MAG: LysR family transcriptional regulator [Gemmataceae bacterium]|nr:LysR family transcriptional regulator [Gemmataceae bacterium]